MIADTFDPYLNYTRPSARTICAHSDEDPCENSGLTPFTPFGSVDAKPMPLFAEPQHAVTDA